MNSYRIGNNFLPLAIGKREVFYFLELIAFTKRKKKQLYAYLLILTPYLQQLRLHHFQGK